MMDDGGLQPPRHLLEKQHSRLQELQETTRVIHVIVSLTRGPVAHKSRTS